MITQNTQCILCYILQTYTLKGGYYWLTGPICTKEVICNAWHYLIKNNIPLNHEGLEITIKPKPFVLNVILHA